MARPLCTTTLQGEVVIRLSRMEPQTPESGSVRFVSLNCNLRQHPVAVVNAIPTQYSGLSTTVCVTHIYLTERRGNCKPKKPENQFLLLSGKGG